MNYALYVLAGLQVVGALFTVGRIGKPRKPTTPGDAVVIMVVSAIFVTILILAARGAS